MEGIDTSTETFGAICRHSGVHTSHTGKGRSLRRHNWCKELTDKMDSDLLNGFNSVKHEIQKLCKDAKVKMLKDIDEYVQQLEGKRKIRIRSAQFRR